MRLPRTFAAGLDVVGVLDFVSLDVPGVMTSAGRVGRREASPAVLHVAEQDGTFDRAPVEAATLDAPLTSRLIPCVDVVSPNFDPTVLCPCLATNRVGDEWRVEQAGLVPLTYRRHAGHVVAGDDFNHVPESDKDAPHYTKQEQQQGRWRHSAQLAAFTYSTHTVKSKNTMHETGSLRPRRPLRPLTPETFKFR